MRKIIDKEKFGPWAIVTGASSGIGKGFAWQLAAAGLNIVLVARRIVLLEELGRELVNKFGVGFLAIEADLGEEGAISKIVKATSDLDIGLLISNAGTGKPGKFLSFSEKELKYILQLNAISHLALVHHFSRNMVIRKRGGILLTGAMGASDGIAYMANECGTKGYVLSLGKSLHSEFKTSGVHVTVLVTSPTETPVLDQLGFNKDNIPMKPVSVEQCVDESLRALSANRITIIPGFRYRVLNRLIPGAISREMAGRIMKRNNKLD